MDQMLYAQIYVHFSIIEIVKKIERMFCMAQLLQSIFSHERNVVTNGKCLCYNIVNKAEYKIEHTE